MIYNSSETAKKFRRLQEEQDNARLWQDNSRPCNNMSGFVNNMTHENSIVCDNSSFANTSDIDTDDEIGYMIYMSSETAKARARSVAEAANNKPSPSDSETTTSVLSNKRKSNAVHDELQKKKNVRS